MKLGRRAWPSGRALDWQSGGPGFKSSSLSLDGFDFSGPEYSTPCHFVNSQLVSLPPVGILNLLCLVLSYLFVTYLHLIIFTWNLRNYHYY